jgi:D-3-phosphoglycerate dehydrogenase / 2-oxoglutarate reductase
MPTVLLTDSDRFPFDEEDRATLAGAGVALRELPGHEPEQVVAASQGAAAIFVYHAKLTRETIARLDDCRVLARCGTGYDNIDVAAARERGIEVVYVPDYGIDDVADHALALVFASARKLALCDRAVRAGEWPGYGELAPMFRLGGRTLGVYGYGRIGRRLADKARALGMNVIAHDPWVPEAAATKEELLRKADVVSVHLPLSDETRHAVGEAELALMKPTSILVNTSRGPIVDTVALAAALRERRLAGAGLDVFEEGPLPADHPLRACETAVFTPHSAAYTEEALAEVRKRPLADALRILRGDAPRNPVPS